MDRGEHERRAVAILDVGGVNDRADEMTLRIDNDVALAPLDCRE
jgi:hypothetical protein